MKAILVCLLIIAVIEHSHAAFQCYKCNDCGNTFNTARHYMVFTEGGANYCTKRIVGDRVIKDYSAQCNDGYYCCQGDLCNSSNSKYHVNFGVFMLLSTTGFIIRQF